MKRVAVVGASLAGATAVETLRASGFDGAITMIGAEEHAPYERPPLSKAVLAGKLDPLLTSLRAEEEWGHLDVEWILGTRATGLDSDGRTVRLEGGETVPYDGLVIATGARARTLPLLNGGGDPRVQVLRTVDDAMALRDALDRASRVVIVGAGFIGCEVAAVCRTRGVDVVLVDPLSHPLARAAGPAVGGAIAAIHREEGVDLRLGVGVDGLVPSSDSLVVSVGGEPVEADLCVVGVGAIPNVEWLQGSRLAIADGVVCSQGGATGAAGIVAAGDVARWPHPLAVGGSIRVEHWSNAIDQGRMAAQTLLDAATVPSDIVPYVWSDQYDVSLQVHGFVGDADTEVVAAGSAEGRDLFAVYARDGFIIGVIAFGNQRLSRGFAARITARARLSDLESLLL